MTFVDCNKVFVDVYTFNSAGLGAFASKDIKKGELIEKGVTRLIECNGNLNPYLFTWSEDRTKWAFCSGCAPFYNTSLNPNTNMVRNFEKNIFSIYAERDIKHGDELTHKYKSLEWRECFSDLNQELKQQVN